MTPSTRVDRILAEISGVAAQYGITSWEREFLASVKERGYLSQKQDAILVKIEQRVFGDEE